MSIQLHHERLFATVGGQACAINEGDKAAMSAAVQSTINSPEILSQLRTRYPRGFQNLTLILNGNGNLVVKEQDGTMVTLATKVHNAPAILAPLRGAGAAAPFHPPQPFACPPAPLRGPVAPPMFVPPQAAPAFPQPFYPPAPFYAPIPPAPPQNLSDMQIEVPVGSPKPAPSDQRVEATFDKFLAREDASRALERDLRQRLEDQDRAFGEEKRRLEAETLQKDTALIDLQLKHLNEELEALEKEMETYIFRPSAHLFPFSLPVKAITVPFKNICCRKRYQELEDKAQKARARIANLEAVKARNIFLISGGPADYVAIRSLVLQLQSENEMLREKLAAARALSRLPSERSIVPRSTTPVASQFEEETTPPPPSLLRSRTSASSHIEGGKPEDTMGAAHRRPERHVHFQTSDPTRDYSTFG